MKERNYVTAVLYCVVVFIMLVIARIRAEFGLMQYTKFEYTIANVCIVIVFMMLVKLIVKIKRKS